MSKQDGLDADVKAMPYMEYQNALKLSKEYCELIAKLARIPITFDDSRPPGELLMKMLYRYGHSIRTFRNLLSAAQEALRVIYYKPQTKVAILIANEKYQHLSKLATPSIDCHSLSANLKNLGFNVVMIKNTTSDVLRDILSCLFELIPQDSYCFIFYAGHGCQIGSTKFMMGIDCPKENIYMSHCITENYLMEQVYKCKPDLCILIMDMCRMSLDRKANPEIYTLLSSIEEYEVHKNLMIIYSTQSSQAAYEVLQIECSTTISETYELRTGDSARIVPGGSQYVNSLCTRIVDNIDISSLFDKVHEDVENSMRKQRPIKVQWGASKRGLYDPSIGDIEGLLDDLKLLAMKYDDYCSAF